jgi:tetratricopeptide (TPR) repeat protein
VVALLVLWRTVGPVLRQRGLDRSATATARGLPPTPRQPPDQPLPPAGGDLGEPYPIRVDEGYASPGSLPAEEAEARLAQIDKSIRQDAQNPRFHLDRGNVLFLVRRFSEAEESYRRTIELDGGIADAHYNLGVTLIYMRQPEQALGEFQWIVDTAGGRDQPPVLFNLGLAHAMLDHRLEAVAALRDFLRLAPTEDPHRQRATDILRRFGEE